MGLQEIEHKPRFFKKKKKKGEKWILGSLRGMQMMIEETEDEMEVGQAWEQSHRCL